MKVMLVWQMQYEARDGSAHLYLRATSRGSGKSQATAQEPSLEQRLREETPSQSLTEGTRGFHVKPTAS